MTDFTLTAVAVVRGGRVENEDDAWGAVEAQVVLEPITCRTRRCRGWTPSPTR